MHYSKVFAFALWIAYACFVAGCSQRALTRDASDETGDLQEEALKEGPSVARSVRLSPALLPAVAGARSKRAEMAGRAYARSPRGARAKATALNRFSPSVLPSNTMAVHAIDVGQADAFLLEFKCAAALIDTGLEYTAGNSPKQRLADYLEWFFTERRPDLNNTLALAVLSHSHADHANGVPIVLGDAPGAVSLSVQNVVDNGYDVLAGADEQQRLRSSASVSAESVSAAAIDWYEGATSATIDPIGACDSGEADPLIRVLWGAWDEIEGAPANPNHHSVVMRVDYGESSFLFTGDIQTGTGGQVGGLEAMLEDYAADNSAFDVDVLKVAHHGAANGTTDAFVKATTPCLAMMGVGRPDTKGTGSAWGHGHPRRETLQRLTMPNYGVSGSRPLIRVAAFDHEEEPHVMVDLTQAIFATAWDGHFVVYAGADGTLQVEAEHTDVTRYDVDCD